MGSYASNAVFFLFLAVAVLIMSLIAAENLEYAGVITVVAVFVGAMVFSVRS